MSAGRSAPPAASAPARPGPGPPRPACQSIVARFTGHRPWGPGAVTRRGPALGIGGTSTASPGPAAASPDRDSEGPTSTHWQVLAKAGCQLQAPRPQAPSSGSLFGRAPGGGKLRVRFRFLRIRLGVWSHGSAIRQSTPPPGAAKLMTRPFASHPSAVLAPPQATVIPPVGPTPQGS